MIIPLFTLFFLILLYSSGNWLSNKSNIIFLVLVTLVLILMVTFRSPFTPDYQNYLGLFDYEHENKEVGYLLLIRLAKRLTSSPLGMFLLSALLSVTLKIVAIRKMSPFFYLSLITYVSNIFILHDMIQMRCAIASGIILWSVYFFSRKEYLYYLFSALLAFSFHYSAIIIFLLPLLSGQGFNRYIALGAMLIVYVLAIFGVGFGYLWSKVTYGIFANMWEIYSGKMDNGELVTINIFNTIFLFRFILCSILVINYT